MKVIFRTSKRQGKKYDAIFIDEKTKSKVRTVSFGAKGMSDFTKHKNPERKQRYIKRHKKNENWNNPYKPGTLSRYILWNKPSLKASITSYKKRFKLN